MLNENEKMARLVTDEREFSQAASIPLQLLNGYFADSYVSRWHNPQELTSKR